MSEDKCSPDGQRASSSVVAGDTHNNRLQTETTTESTTDGRKRHESDSEVDDRVSDVVCILQINLLTLMFLFSLFFSDEQPVPVPQISDVSSPPSQSVRHLLIHLSLTSVSLLLLFSHTGE